MRIRRYSRSRSGAGMVEYGMVVGLVAVGAILAVDRAGGSVEGLFSGVGDDLSNVQVRLPGQAAGTGPADPAPVGASCRAILDAGDSTGDGVYEIDPDGDGGVDPFDAYCDMTSAGGGWTMVAAQFEGDALADWNEGIQGDYDPTLVGGASFALSSSELPAHGQTAFGRDTQAADVDYVDFVYTTGDIPVTLVSGHLTGQSYQIHRDLRGNHWYIDPEESYVPKALGDNWTNSLTFDATGGLFYTWAFVPLVGADGDHGFSYLGNRRGADGFAWTVWVR